MSQLFDRIQRRFPRLGKLSLREKMLLIAASVAVVGFLLNTLLFQPLDREEKHLREEIGKAAANISQQQAELVELSTLQARDPARIAWDKLNGLKKQQSLSQRELQRALARVIADSRPDEILRQILAPYPGLRVVQVNKGEAQSFSLSKEGDKQGENHIRIQSLEVEFEGTYLTFLGYLKRLEGASLRLFWDDFELETLTPPQNRLRLKLHYLFFDREMSHA
jgi:type II secretory pathway component PulM